MGSRDPRIDSYIKNAAPFAKPILEQLREIVHEACPDCVENIKWSRPCFDYKGPMAGMAAFKAHMTFGFWMNGIMRDQGADAATITKLDRMESIKDLPAKKSIVSCIKRAMAMNDAGIKMLRERTANPKPVVIPPALKAALAQDKAAREAFDGFSPSARREYCEWIADAKREETRDARLAKLLEQVKEGKQMHWKYQTTPAKTAPTKKAPAKKAPAKKVVAKKTVAKKTPKRSAK